jgi:hypothetical protein
MKYVGRKIVNGTTLAAIACSMWSLARSETAAAFGAASMCET